jgi:outer membrane protein assembly factor BamB
LDAATGEMVWFKDIDSAIGYTGCFVPGNPNRLIAGCVSSKLYCFNTANGDILWEDPYGYAGFAAQGGGVGYGMYYEQYFNLDGLHYAAWDVETGEKVWDNLAGRNEVSVPYINPAIADGKVYIQVQRQDPVTERNTQTTVCFDAYNGEPIFEIATAFATPSIAYGNLYGGASSYMWCFGPPADWSMFRGSADMPGVAEGQAGPVNLEYKWVFNTGGPVTSSASVVDGKVYIGSFDHNIYCLDAYSGEEIWSFETNDRVLATPAVWGGIVYSGIEDGTLYALNKDTGALLFSRSGFATSDLAFAPAAFSIRSSPIISDDGRLFIGGMDHKIYCLNTLTGATLWQVQTGGPVGASAVVVDGVVYIASTDMYLYAINANTGAVLWKAMTPHDDAPRIAQVPPIDPAWARSVGLEIFQICSVAPAPDLGLVIIGGNRDYRDNNPATTVGNLFAFNMSNGELVWWVNVPGSNFAGASPAYYDGYLYHSFGQRSYKIDATNGTEIWNCWTTFQGFSSPTVTGGDVTGLKMYYGNGFYTLNVIDGETGLRTAFQTIGSQIISSPAIWENKVYIGGTDFNVYCFQGNPPSF